jgi:hypothetical protein
MLLFHHQALAALNAFHVDERQHIIVNSAECAVLPMLHSVVEGINDAMLKVSAARMSGDNYSALPGPHG